MAANGQADPEKLAQEVEEDLELTATAPIRPIDRYTGYKRGGRTYAYYQSIPWPEWWDEFNTALDPKSGRWKYKTLNAFIQTKSKGVQWQKELLWEMIGPEPRLKNDKQQLRVPYLGDWERRRKNGFWCFDDEGKVRMVRQAIQEKHEALHATRALAPLLAARIARWKRIAEIVDQRCQAVILSEGKIGPKARLRLEFYIQMQQNVENVLADLDRQWMRIFGVNPNDPGRAFVEMAAIGGKIGAAAALTGVAAVTGNAAKARLTQDGQEYELPERVTYDSLLMADMLQAHEKTYNIPLPEEVRTQARKQAKTQ